MTFISRFAPSPTGPLHLGHAYSALLAHDMADAAAGTFLLRIEDIDGARSRPEWEAQILDDLAWLGLHWPVPVLRQSEHLARYNTTLLSLAARGLIYPCSCSRADIAAAQSAPQEGRAQPGLYPGTCRGRPMQTRRPGDALRLDIAKAADMIGPALLQWHESGPLQPGPHSMPAQQLIASAGDPVLGRKELETASYLLACVLDDAFQGITHVVRGADLLEFTALQVLLQRLLHLPTPIYHHHHLIRDAAGKRLAKRDDARAIAAYRADGASPEDIRRLVGLV